jgi:hypothetical protein
MHVPRLRWNHACRRAAFRRATLPEVPATSRLGRSVRSHLQARTFLVHRRAQSLCASFFSDPDLAHSSRSSDVYCRGVSTYQCPLGCQRTGCRAPSHTNQNRLSRIQIPPSENDLAISYGKQAVVGDGNAVIRMPGALRFRGFPGNENSRNLPFAEYLGCKRGL